MLISNLFDNNFLIKWTLKSYLCPQNLSKIHAETRKILIQSSNKRLEEKKRNNKNNLNQGLPLETKTIIRFLLMQYAISVLTANCMVFI